MNRCPVCGGSMTNGICNNPRCTGGLPYPKPEVQGDE